MSRTTDKSSLFRVVRDNFVLTPVGENGPLATVLTISRSSSSPTRPTTTTSTSFVGQVSASFDSQMSTTSASKLGVAAAAAAPTAAAAAKLGQQSLQNHGSAGAAMRVGGPKVRLKSPSTSRNRPYRWQYADEKRARRFVLYHLGQKARAGLYFTIWDRNRAPVCTSPLGIETARQLIQICRCIC